MNRAPLTLDNAAQLGALSLLTPQEAAEVLRRTERTLEAWRYRGTGPAFVRIGPRRVAYHVRDVLAFAGDAAADRKEAEA